VEHYKQISASHFSACHDFYSKITTFADDSLFLTLHLKSSAQLSRVYPKCRLKHILGRVSRPSYDAHELDEKDRLKTFFSEIQQSLILVLLKASGLRIKKNA